MSASPSTADTPRRYTRRTESQWRELIARHEQTDLKVEEFCRQHKIATSGFYTWRKRFDEEATATHTNDERLIDITQHLQAHPSTTAQDVGLHIELELGHGCVLRIRAR